MFVGDTVKRQSRRRNRLLRIESHIECSSVGTRCETLASPRSQPPVAFPACARGFDVEEPERTTNTKVLEHGGFFRKQTPRQIAEPFK
jgi:hypothetical protein